MLKDSWTYMMVRYFLRLVTVILSLALLSACSPSGNQDISDWSSEFGEYISQDVEWNWCRTTEEIRRDFLDEINSIQASDLSFQESLEAEREAEGVAQWRSSLECSSIRVPLDYSNPGGADISLRVIRRKATEDSKDKTGTIIVHPGGPGISGVDLLNSPLFEGEALGSFDLVSFDQRGFSSGNKVECVSSQSVAGMSAVLDGNDDLSSSTSSLLEGVVDACVSSYGDDFLRNMGTENVARDVDIIRILLGEDQINFVGYSYSAYLGMHYANQFPSRVRSLVLDSPVSMEGTALDMALGQYRAIHSAWDRFSEKCSEDDRPCPVDDPSSLSSLIESMADEGIVVNGVEGDRYLLSSWVVGRLYRESDWSTLREVLDYASSGDMQEVQGVLDRYIIDPLHIYQGPALATLCADRGHGVSVQDYIDAFENLEEESIFSGIAVRGSPCAYWPKPDYVSPLPLSQADFPVLVVGASFDPATPYEWADELASQLSNASLVTHGENFHAIAGHRVNDCIDGLVEDFLVYLENPSEDNDCSR